MRKFMLTAAGLSTVGLCGAAMADADITYDVTGPGGNQVDYDVEMSGVLGDANITCDFVNNGGWTWAGDLLLGFVAPNGSTVEFGGYDMSFGYESAGDFPSSWDSSTSGTYSHSFNLGGYGLEGGGSWTVQVSDGYSSGASTDQFSGTLTLVGMDGGGGGDPWGGCCMGTDCDTMTQANCEDGGGTYLGDGTNCDGWPCGGAPEGACCFGGGDCIDSDIVACGKLGGDFAGEGTTCAGGACDASAGDTCAAAVVVGAGSHAFDTATATDSGYGDPDESQCEGTFLDWEGSPDRWFKWTATEDGTVTFDTCDANSYDTSLVLYEGDDCGSLVQIACNGDDTTLDGCQTYSSYIGDIYATSGSSYYIRIGGWQGATGPGTLTITAGGGGDPTGACCIDSNCYIQTGGDCFASGGEYYGDGSNCGSVDCGGGEPMGACCLDSDCSTLSSSDCDIFGGAYQGDGSDCGNVDCSGSGDGWPTVIAPVGNDLVAGQGGTWTFDIVIEVGEGGRLDAVAGTGAQMKMLANSGDFYQHPFGGPVSPDVNPNLYSAYPDLEWDSRVTIGALDSSGDPFPENALQSVGIDWSGFENGGDMVTDNGTWFVLPTDVQGTAEAILAADCSTVWGVRIARLTATAMDDVITFEGVVQGTDGNGDFFNDVSYIEASYMAVEDCNDNGVNDMCDIANGTSEDNNGDGIPDECENPCPGDADGDGDVDVDDILIVIADFGGSGNGDVDGNGETNVDDLLLVISWFGNC
ncbi:MAG: hypothetical protein MK101_09390 [Phycisphaerales bacterium]|nr:hypothetical protein [Phycisphaerales bacterium]